MAATQRASYLEENDITWNKKPTEISRSRSADEASEEVTNGRIATMGHTHDVPDAGTTNIAEAVRKGCESHYVHAAVQGASKIPAVSNAAGPILLPAAVAIDSVRLGMSIQRDIDEDNAVPKNTVKSASSIAGAWGAGIAGALGGATAGTAIVPGVGTVIGGIVGGVAGAVGGSIAGEKIGRKIVDKIDKDDDSSSDEDSTSDEEDKEKRTGDEKNKEKSIKNKKPGTNHCSQ